MSPATPQEAPPTRASDGDLPPAQYVGAEHVLATMAEEGRRRIQGFSAAQVFVLAVMAGAFITMGALFSVLLGEGAGSGGAERLVEGLGFSAGFFFVILSGGVLFTEANAVMPATLLQAGVRATGPRVLRFWVLALVGNAVGALVAGTVIGLVQHYPAGVTDLLGGIVERKMQWRAIDTAGAWFQVVLSGMLANWLVGMAAFFATMGRTILGKYVPVFLAVSAFVAANLQHSPANMGFFSLAGAFGVGPGWGPALFWNLLPAAIGNLLGGAFLVAVPLRYALRPGRPAARSGGDPVRI